MMVALDKQFLEMPVEVLILGDGATVDPVTNLPIPASRESLDDFDLVPNYAARAVGATSALSKGMKQQNLVQLLQAMGAMPEIMGSINAVNFWRGMFREFEIPNINEIFTPAVNPNLAALVDQATGGQGGLGQVPTSGQMVQGAIPTAPGIGPGAAGQRGRPLGTLPGMIPGQENLTSVLPPIGRAA
jgi:hypothetical protein